MSLNILDLVKDQVSGHLAKEASNYLGESENAVSKALGGMMPALLGSMIQKSSSNTGAQGIMDLLGKLDLGSLSNIAGLFGGGSSNVNGLLNSGGGIVDMLLGGKSKGLIDTIAGISGMKSESSSTLLKMAAPLLMGVIGKQVQGKGLSALTSLLSGQKSFVNAAMPAGLGSILNFGDFSAPKVEMPSSNMGGGNGWMKWLLPLLLAGGLIYWLAGKGCGNKVVEATQSATDVVSDAANTAVDATVNAAETVTGFFKRTLSTGFELLNASETGIESQLITFVEDKNAQVAKDLWFNFDRLLFDTGKATLQAGSQEQLTNIAEILKAFPAVKAKVGGYTDNVGDAKSNLKLSSDRAYNVMNELVKLGVAKERLTAEGYGDAHPVASNDTEEGRQQNRRIAMRVTEK